MDDEQIKRFLRAHKGSPDKARKALEDTLQWRKDTGVDAFSKEMWPAELKLGKIYVWGNDAAGRSVMVIRKRKDRMTPEAHKQNLKYLIWTLEVCIHCIQPPQDQWVVILDMSNYSSGNSPPLSVTLDTLRVFSNHYPERLYRAFVVDAPTIFFVLWRVVRPFVDPVTREKVHFVYTKNAKADEGGFQAYRPAVMEEFDFEKYVEFLESKAVR